MHRCFFASLTNGQGEEDFLFFFPQLSADDLHLFSEPIKNFIFSSNETIFSLRLKKIRVFREYELLLSP